MPTRTADKSQGYIITTIIWLLFAESAAGYVRDRALGEVVQVWNLPRQVCAAADAGGHDYMDHPG